MIMNNRTLYATHDFPLASFLIYSGIPVHGIDRQPNGHATFLFEKRNGIDERIQRFWARTVQVDPLGFHQTEKALKARLYSET